MAALSQATVSVALTDMAKAAKVDLTATHSQADHTPPLLTKLMVHTDITPTLASMVSKALADSAVLVVSMAPDAASTALADSVV